MRNTRRIRRFNPVQTAIVVAVIYLFISAIFILPFAFFAGTMSEEMDMPMGGMFSGLALIGLPFMYSILGFIVTLVGCAIYNLVAGWTGGIEIELEDLQGGGGGNEPLDATH